MSTGRQCYVYMKKDVEKTGMAGQLKLVSRGFAENFLVKNGYALIVSEKELNEFKKKNDKITEDATVLESATSMLAERIKSTTIILKEKTHEKEKLYGSIKDKEIVDALREKGISINKRQVVFHKPIKTIGDHKVLIKLTSKIQAELVVKIVSI